jgi:signal transduction histidine kinase
MMAISLIVTFFIARFKMSVELDNLGKSIAKSYRTDILNGDIRFSERQIRDFLNLNNNEEFTILDKNYSPSYNAPLESTNFDIENSTRKSHYLDLIKSCGVGITCFENYFGPAYLTVPIYFDNSQTSLAYLLFIAKRVSIDWVFVTIVFLIVSLGYLIQLLTIGRVVNLSTRQLKTEITKWANRLKYNPKDSAPLNAPPFTELTPLQHAIEGLNYKIENYENAAEQKAKLTVLRGIAHDILGPVNQLQLNLATLEQILPNTDLINEIMQDLDKSVKKVSGIANQVKALNQDFAIANIQTANLSLIIDDFIKLISKSPDISNKNIKFIFNNALINNYQISLSKTEFERILQNLLQNAIHASQQNGKIWINLSEVDDNLILGIRDEGCGIPSAIQKNIFDPDFTTKENLGTGLGLSIVKYICDLRNCKIDFNSEINEGSNFKILIPKYVSHQNGGDNGLSVTDG